MREGIGLAGAGAGDDEEGVAGDCAASRCRSFSLVNASVAPMGRDYRRLLYIYPVRGNSGRLLHDQAHAQAASVLLNPRSRNTLPLPCTILSFPFIRVFALPSVRASISGLG